MRLFSIAVVRSVLAVAAAASIIACDDDASGPSNTGRVRVVHAVSNVTGVDVLLNTTSYKTNLAYKSSEGYRSTASGATAVKIRKTGSTTDLTTVNQNIANAADYTVFAAGTEAAPQSFLFADNNSAPAAGKVKLRAVHAAIGRGAVDVYILGNANELANATPARANLAEKAASDYIVRDAGTFVIILTTAGTKTPVLTITGVQVAAGKIRTIAAVEKVGGGAPLEGVVLIDN